MSALPRPLPKTGPRPPSHPPPSSSSSSSSTEDVVQRSCQDHRNLAVGSWCESEKKRLRQR